MRSSDGVRSSDVASSEENPALHGVLLLLAIIAGVAVANIYYNQPLLDAFRQSFPGQKKWIAAVPAAAQIGYAAGMLLLAPLGDRHDRKQLILWQTVGTCLALLAVILAPNMLALAGASLAVGIFSTIAQQAVPFAAELAPARKRGQAVGTVMSGLLMGILLARTAAGVVGQHFGWRAVFSASIALLLLMALVIAAKLPSSKPTSSLRYGRLMLSIWHLAQELPALRQTSVTGGLLFAAFSLFWSMLALQLAGAPFHLGPQAAGLFGLVGAAGALAAPYAGRFADRRGPHAIVALAIGLMLLSFVIFALSGRSLIGLVVGVILVDVGMQSAQISNQSRIYALRPEARSRINTVYMTSYFIGGAIGSAVGVSVWHAFGWVAACVTGLAFVSAAGIANEWKKW
jgi:predicted MFS family arabinose efflux permease